MISKYKSGFLPPQDVASEEVSTTGSLQRNATSKDKKRAVIFGRFRSAKVIVNTCNFVMFVRFMFLEPVLETTMVLLCALIDNKLW